MNLKNIFYKKTVIVTGHTGFKGSWLSLWLKILGAKVIGISTINGFQIFSQISTRSTKY